MIIDRDLIASIALVWEFFERNEENTYAWFQAKNLNFGGLTPHQLFQNGRGHKVRQFVEQARSYDIRAANQPDSEGDEL